MNHRNVRNDSDACQLRTRRIFLYPAEPAPPPVRIVIAAGYGGDAGGCIGLAARDAQRIVFDACIRIM